jgi:hypothetical protein
MITRVSVGSVVEFLLTFFEGRLDNDYQTGKQEMAATIHEKFGLSMNASRDLIDYLERKNTIRYITGVETEHEAIADYRRSETSLADDTGVLVAPLVSGLATGYSAHQAVAFIPQTSTGSGRQHEYIEQGVGYWSVGRPD